MKNPIMIKSYGFAVDIVKLCREQQTKKREFVLSKQLLRSATSVGANIREAQEAVSKKDFVYRLQISLKEARESAYWIDLLHDTDMIGSETYKLHAGQIGEISRMLISIIVTTKKRYNL